MSYKKLLIILCRVIILIFILINVYHLIQDRVNLGIYLNTIEDRIGIKPPLSYENILDIRNFVLNDIDSSSINTKKRPKIGWTLRKIIKNKKGLCGEGARLLFHILNYYNLDSRRVYLHGNDTLHVVLEVGMDGKWFLLDTINSPGENFRNMLDEQKGPIEEYFDFGPFRYHVTPRDKIQVYKFVNFSYLPFNGILNNRIFKTEMYIHKPVPKCINLLLETPNLIYLLFWIILLFIMSIKPILRWMKKSIRSRDGSLCK